MIKEKILKGNNSFSHPFGLSSSGHNPLGPSGFYFIYLCIVLWFKTDPRPSLSLLSPMRRVSAG